MKVLQHYYTSFVNRETGRAGFQVKAMSPGISAETQATIARLIAYRIPNDIEERALERHPVAFRYFYHNPQECILLCSQSSGDDENGRPGNFFAHSVVMSPDELANQPPILYWRSPFWRKQAAETQIKPLPAFDAEMSFHIIDEMWAFLADESHKEAFYKLMCAVVQSESTKRRIIIIDSDNHVALWIAAVSCMLPPAYRPLLSFATYHHDPYQSWFLITGTPDDTIFRSTPEESVSHFVLDGRTCRTSPVEKSQYAQLVRNCTNPESYEKHMLGYFLLHEQRFPKPTCIDEQLDLFVTYLALRQKKNPIAVSDMLQAVDVVLTTFEKLPSYSNEDREELARLKAVLEDARHKSRSANVLKAYERVVRLYQKHNMPTNEILQNDLWYCTELLLEDSPKGAPEEAISMLKHLRQTYNDDLFVQYANQDSYLQYIVDTLQTSYYSKLLLVWKYIGCFLRPGSHSQRLFEKSIYTWENLLQSQRQAEAKELFALIKHAIAGKELEWLKILAATTPQTGIMVKHFYWQLVSAFSLEQREPYRGVVQQIIPAIVKYELFKELDKADLESKIAVISRWVAYITQHPDMYDAASLVNEGLDKVKTQCNTHQWRKLALEVLTHDDLLPSLSQKKDRLVEEALSRLTLQDFSSERIQLYKRYRDHASLSPESKNVLVALIAMADGDLDATGAAQTYEYVSTLTSGEKYYGEIHCFIDAIFERDITGESHFFMVSALYVWQYREQFWLSYWNKLHAMLTRLLTNNLERAVRLFSFWFAFLPGKATRTDQYYMVHQFFLGLRHHMNDGATLADYPAALNNLAGKAASNAWYPLIQELLRVRKKGMVEKGQEWMKLVQRKIPAQKVDEQAQELERTSSADVNSLLSKGTVREQHIQNLLAVYSRSGRELFWTIYTKQLMRVLTTKDIEHFFEVYHFWFDESFNYVGQEPYIAQEFFIKVSQVFENALKEHERDFRETARLVIARCDPLMSRGEGYAWYFMIRPFFVEALSTQRRLR